MLEAWRIVKDKYADTAFTGEGAARTGGRWNTRGLRAVYTSGTRALAILETIVHLNPPMPLYFKIFRITFNEKLVEELDRARLSNNWRALPAPPSTQFLGDQWLRQGRSAILKLPSIIVPEECNYLLNPIHRDFNQIEIGLPSDFIFDSRLMR